MSKEKMSNENNLWYVFAAFVLAAIYLNWHSNIFISSSVGPLAAGKYIAWCLFAAFLSYTIYCSAGEEFFPTVRRILEFRWGRQVTLDLYLGLLLSAAVIYANEGLLFLAWLIPMLCFGNLATLLYVAIHYDALLARLG